jgi:multidrug resistance efflux pump
VRPGQQLVDSVNQLMLAREQLSWARMEFTRCQTLASEGTAVEGELARAQTELARWQAQHDEAMRALQSMGYRARLP